MEDAGSERETRPPPEDTKEKKKLAPGRSSSSDPPPEEGTGLTTPRERWEAAKREFVRAVIADAKADNDTTAEEDIEEYRRAGKLHRYDPDTEWMKRVARKHPPPEGFAPDVADFLRLLEEDERAPCSTAV